MADETLLDHVAEIVCAHVGNNSVSASYLPDLIRSVYGSLAVLGQTPERVEETPTPAVAIRSSVKPDAVICLECGAQMKMLKRHLGAGHGMTPAEYRKRWSLSADYPMIAPGSAANRKELKAEPAKVAIPRKKLRVASGMNDAG